jgi:23S rRNA pseudouridine1911/1915/1917 synthase
MPPSAALVDLVVTRALAGERLDRAIAQLCPNVSRMEARRMIAGGAVFVDNHRTRIASKLLHVGQRLVCYRLVVPEASLEPTVLLAHADFLVLDKPAGMAVAATRSGDVGTVERWLVKQGHPALLTHRLDAPVSGALVAALNAESQATFNRLFVEHTVDRRYLAVVAPAPAWDERTIETPLDDQAARTLAQVIERSDRDAALVEVRLQTGRFRQIRRHLAAEGSPVLGDRDQLDARAAPRIMLHAFRVAFPWQGEEIDVQCPPPAEFNAALVSQGLTAQ